MRQGIFSHMGTGPGAALPLSKRPRRRCRLCASTFEAPSRYDIPTRYPNAFDRGVPAEQFFEADARQALDHAKEVAKFARGIIGSP